jgi:hypothetical protein
MAIARTTPTMTIDMDELSVVRLMVRVSSSTKHFGSWETSGLYSADVDPIESGGLQRGREFGLPALVRADICSAGETCGPARTLSAPLSRRALA